MSLEAKIEALTAAVLANTAALQQMVPPPAQAAPVPAPAAPVAAPSPAPNVAVPGGFPPPVAAAPAMPAPPSFAPPVPAPAAPAAAPFSDQKGLMEYVMARYNEYGQEKGARIQEVLTALGCGTVTDVKPEQYAAFYQDVEALRG